MKKRDPRVALRTTASFSTLFAILGKTVLGFEQSLFDLVATVCVGLFTAFVLEIVDARFNGRAPAFMGGGWLRLVDWMAAPYMTSLTISFLVFDNSGIAVSAFAAVAALSSKYVFRFEIDGRPRHFMNPSNFGLCAAFLLFHRANVLPYEYTEALHGSLSFGEWVIPMVILVLGLRINILYTRRAPLIVAFFSAFLLQALLRSAVRDIPLASSLAPFTGIAFVLFALYMFTDPMTSPASRSGQIAFGAGIAFAYGTFVELGVFYAMFFGVSVVCAFRGAYLYYESRVQARAAAGEMLVSEARSAVPVLVATKQVL